MRAAASVPADLRETLEDLLIDLRGDVMLLDMVLDYVEDAASTARLRAGKTAESVLQVPLTEDRLTALAQARLHSVASLRRLEAAFYGEGKS